MGITWILQWKLRKRGRVRCSGLRSSLRNWRDKKEKTIIIISHNSIWTLVSSFSDFLFHCLFWENESDSVKKTDSMVFSVEILLLFLLLASFWWCWWLFRRRSVSLSLSLKWNGSHLNQIITCIMWTCVCCDAYDDEDLLTIHSFLSFWSFYPGLYSHTVGWWCR